MDNGAEEIVVICNDMTTLVPRHLIDIQRDGLKGRPIPLRFVVKSTPSSMHSFHEISQYLTDGSYNNHEARRDRKLLLNKKEIRYLEQNTKHQSGFTIIPIKLYINDKGFAKLDIALAKGKKEYDKRNTLKDKEDRREMDRAMKRFV